MLLEVLKLLGVGFVFLVQFCVQKFVIVCRYLGCPPKIHKDPLNECQVLRGRGFVVVGSFYSRVVFLGFGLGGCCHLSAEFCFFGSLKQRRGVVNLNSPISKVLDFSCSLLDCLGESDGRNLIVQNALEKGVVRLVPLCL